MTVATFRPRRMMQRRKLILSYGDSEDHAGLHAAITKVRSCGLAYSNTEEGRRKREAGIRLSTPCGLRICPDCERVRRLGYADCILRHLDGVRTSALGMLTIKMPLAPSTWPAHRHERGLLPMLLRQKEGYELLLRTDSLLASRDGAFRLGLWRIHCRWSINEHAWDVHRHLIVAGNPIEADINAIRNHWARLTGRDDPDTVDYARLRNRSASFRYLSTELASTFASTKDHDNISDQLDEAWSMAFNHYDATAEYLWTLRQRPCNFIGTFGRASANCNR